MTALRAKPVGLTVPEFTTSTITTAIADARASGADLIVQAQATPRLSMRIGRQRITWRSRCYWQGRSDVVRLGHWPDLSVAAAIEAHERAQARARSGFDPSAAALTFDRLTLGELVSKWERASLTRSTPDRVKRLRRHFAHLLAIDAKLITRDQIEEAHTATARRHPAAARGSLKALRSALRWAVARGLLPSDPSAMIKPPKPGTDRRHLALDDLGRVLAALDAAPAWMRNAFTFLAATGCRTGETMRLRLSHWNRAEGRIEIPGALTKTGRDHWVNATGIAGEAVAAAAGRRHAADAPLFTRNGRALTRGDLRALVEFINGARERPAARKDATRWVRLHGCRKSMLTSGAALGLNQAVLDRCLNHVGASSTNAVTDAYMVGERWEERQRTAAAWGAVLAHLRDRARAARDANAQSEQTPDNGDLTAELRAIVKALV